MTKTILGVVAVAIIIGGWYLLTNDTTTENASVTNQMPTNSGENPGSGDGIHNLPAEPAAVAARKNLAAKLSVDEKSIVIMKVEEQTWTDGCLGLGGPAESCLQALVPGFKVELLAKEKTYFYRTDKTGASLRAEVQ